MHINKRKNLRLALAAILVAMLLSSCAGSTADRVNGDAWRYGFSYAGPNYPDTGH
jgi:hypothetical protein